MKKELTSYATLLQAIQVLQTEVRELTFFQTVQFFTEKHIEFDQQDHFKALTLYRMILQSISDLKATE